LCGLSAGGVNFGLGDFGSDEEAEALCEDVQVLPQVANDRGDGGARGGGGVAGDHAAALSGARDGGVPGGGSGGLHDVGAGVVQGEAGEAEGAEADAGAAGEADGGEDLVLHQAVVRGGPGLRERQEQAGPRRPDRVAQSPVPKRHRLRLTCARAWSSHCHIVSLSCTLDMRNTVFVGNFRLDLGADQAHQF
jgi:hypothetical protein